MAVQSIRAWLSIWFSDGLAWSKVRSNSCLTDDSHKILFSCPHTPQIQRYFVPIFLPIALPARSYVLSLSISYNLLTGLTPNNHFSQLPFPPISVLIPVLSRKLSNTTLRAKSLFGRFDISFTSFPCLSLQLHR